MVRGAASLTCYTTSYTIRNWQPCEKLQNGVSQWYEQCTTPFELLPRCSDMVLSTGCPSHGVLPCQFGTDGSTAPQDGSSHCRQADWNTCERGTVSCFKTVRARYKGGIVSDWLVTKGCGGCAARTNEEYTVASACDDRWCYSSEGASSIWPNGCSSDCRWKSQDELEVALCHECSEERCNGGLRRAAHHLATLLFGGVVVALLVRKCTV